MIERYSRQAMRELWSDQARCQSWLEVELAVCEALAGRGVIPAGDMQEIRDKAGFDLERIDEIERTVGHDVIAFLTSVAEKIGPAGRHVHYGLTSSDVVDTAQAWRTVKACDILLESLDDLIVTLREQGLAHRDTVMVGRTHGIHAEPYTLGLKFASWYCEAKRNRERLTAAREEIRFGKISGAVGTYAHLDPGIEADVLERLGLRVEPVATQVIPRDRHAVVLSTLGVLASSLDRIATEIRHLQRSDVREVEEPFRKGQKGSSAMPHKRNPIKCENVSGLARVVRAHVQAALENVALWHERDISHSSVERVILPDATTLCDFMLHRMTRVLAELHVYPERMQQNMQLTRGLIYSQKVLLALNAAGL
ncbi:MAG: adenylosuccinate lyase, partial [Acidobacteria bacterium]|nr:adenylosuccinate lyase [Acidobacteriota bacterium]NIM60836.1 adenylosuccinate lyase [Acidobacteriota bacterium]NIO58687.1 adenylosuccinate lyase [Acidobacteriota bacterium]NIQ29743.1 adenylosuccinate lyase [Acidobacteriota bacterium]NIQ84467.1 adenylosuccinate lyase [Acidobacteriota bacterium]